MRSDITGLSGLLLLSSLHATLASNCNPNKCNANSCYRQVVASAFPTRHTSADCSSFLAITVTPSIVTISETVTATQTATITNTETVDFTVLTTASDIETVTATSTDFVITTDDVFETVTVQTPAVTVIPRAATVVLPSGVPTYASACTSPGQYASACSCIGVLPFTVVAPTPSTTVTVTLRPTVTLTASATVSVGTTETLTTLLTVTTTEVISEPVTATETIQTTVTPTPPCASLFVLQASPSQYATLYFNGRSSAMKISNTNAASAAQFSIDATGRIMEKSDSNFVGSAIYGEQVTGSNMYPVDFNTQEFIQGNSLSYVLCSIDPVTSVLSCSCGVNHIMQIAQSAVYLGLSVSAPLLTLTAVPVPGSCS